MGGKWNFSGMIRRDGGLDPVAATDSLRQMQDAGYESEWVRVDAGSTGSFWHEMGEIPKSVDVLRATTGDGAGAESDLTDLTIGKTADKVTILNGTSTNYFFKVRAL